MSGRSKVRLRELLVEAAGVHCPRLTFESFARLMRYAEAVDWGKRLFD